MCKEGWLVQFGQESCVRVGGGLYEMPEKEVEQKRGGREKQRFQKGGQAGLKGVLKRGGWNPLTNYNDIFLSQTNRNVIKF